MSNTNLLMYTARCYGMHFVDELNGWVCGSGGAVRRTRDGGDTWELLLTGRRELLCRIHAADAERVWACGAGGVILHSQDGGTLWLAQESGTDAVLRDIFFLDAARGWVVGDEGTVLKTVDGGETWVSVESAAISGDVNSVWWSDTQHGWIAGDNGQILRTLDGGTTWTRYYIAGNEEILAVQFIGTNTGYAVGVRGGIFRSDNGGAFWTDRVPNRRVLYVDDVRWLADCSLPNRRPRVEAGPQQAIMIPSGTTLLTGSISDDGLPMSPGVTTSWWSRVSGPGTATFDDPASPETVVHFSAAGTYVLQLDAWDGELHQYDTVMIQVADAEGNQAPFVTAGGNRSIRLPASSLYLNGTVTDDGLPHPPGVTTTLWTRLSGPAPVTFDDPCTVDTTVHFSTNGTYVLSLTAWDGERTLSAMATITVLPEEDANEAPTAHAGPDFVVAVNDVFDLDGIGRDDGLPSSRMDLHWSQVSGPGEAVLRAAWMSTITFGMGSNGPGVEVVTDAANVSFPETGVYVLRLYVSDTVLSATDEVTVRVVEPYGVRTILREDFSGAELTVLTSGVWTVENHGTGHDWVLNTATGRMEVSYSDDAHTEDTWLISPVIDASAYSNVCVRFNEQFRGGYLDHWSYGMLFGSTDGGATWTACSNSLHAYPPNAPERTEPEKTTCLDLSWADGKSAVRLAWRYHALCDNWWRLDDVEITGEMPDIVLPGLLRLPRDAVHAAQRTIRVDTEPGMTYAIEYTDHSLSNGVPWFPFADASNGVGVWTETNTQNSSWSFVDDEGPSTTGGAPANGRRYYRVRIAPTDP